MEFESAQRKSNERPKPVDVDLWPPKLSAIAALLTPVDELT